MSHRPTAALTFCLGLLVAGCEPSNRYVAPPPPEVTVAAPIRRDVTTYREYTGTTQATEAVALRARVKGFLKEMRFKPSDEVKAGDLLFVIDEETFRATLDQANAKLAATESALKQARDSKAREVAAAQVALDEALSLLARIDDARQHALLARNASSREDVDKSEANVKKSAAQVEADKAKLEQARADHETNILTAEANVAGAKAEVKNAEIDLGYCRIKAPIDGRISRNLVDVGNLVGDGQATLLATVYKDDPIYAYVSVSETDLLRFREQVRTGERGDFRKVKIPFELGLADEEGFPHPGRVEYADPNVDPGTGTVQARGIFENPAHKIVPGLFVHLRTPFENRQDALLVPESAVGIDQEGSFVLIVGKNDKVERRGIVPGETVDGLRVVEQGLGPDDRVVVNGLQRARPGARVTPIQPENHEGTKDAKEDTKGRESKKE